MSTTCSAVGRGHTTAGRVCWDFGADLHAAKHIDDSVRLKIRHFQLTLEGFFFDDQNAEPLCQRLISIPQRDEFGSEPNRRDDDAQNEKDTSENPCEHKSCHRSGRDVEAGSRLRRIVFRVSDIDRQKIDQRRQPGRHRPVRDDRRNQRENRDDGRNRVTDQSRHSVHSITSRCVVWPLRARFFS